MKLFTIKCHNAKDGYFNKEVEGTPVLLIEGYSFFVHMTSFDGGELGEYISAQSWTVTEASSGWRVATGPTAEAAIAKAEKNLNENKERFIQMVADAIEQNKHLFP